MNDEPPVSNGDTARPARRVLALPSFERLWNRVVDLAVSALNRAFPDGVRELQVPVRDSQDLEDRVAQGVAKARELGVKLPRKHRKALEAAAAYLLSDRKLTAISRLAKRFDTEPRANREPRLATILLEYWFIALGRHIDATEQLVNDLAPLSHDPKARRELTSRAAAWAKQRRENLAKQRNAVAHANTVWVRAIDEDGLWEPMLALGLGGLDTIAEVADSEFDRDNERFNHRAGILGAVTVEALGQSDELCMRVADLLEGTLSG